MSDSTSVGVPPTAAPALEAKSLYKVFGRSPRDAVARLRAGASRHDVADAGTAAVIDASFTVARGEIFVIMGLSGSGKSTIIRMLNGLLPPTAATSSSEGGTSQRRRPQSCAPSAASRCRWSSSISRCCRT